MAPERVRHACCVSAEPYVGGEFVYEDADAGYRGGDKDDYERAFRRGYEDGYEAGYGRHDRRWDRR